MGIRVCSLAHIHAGGRSDCVEIESPRGSLVSGNAQTNGWCCV